MIFIPFISAILFLVGGQWWKPARWFMGVPIAIVGTMSHHYWAIMAIPAYWIATSAFPYGEKSWIKLPEELKFLVCGLVFGLASITAINWYWALIQTAISGACWWFIKVLDDKEMVKNPWVELLRGFTGTVVYLGG